MPATLPAPITLSPLLDDREFVVVDFATQRFAFIASSGGGKSYGCGRVVEDLARSNVPVVVVDTVGIWPAIRLAADGNSPGLPFVVVGGEHADVPFVPARAGELAKFIIRQNASAVVDVSDLMPDERAAPMAEFFETALIEIKASRRPRFFVLDEAQDLVPEHAGKGEARLVRAVSGFVRKSRNHMCGTALLTQRPQDVSKSVLNQVGNLFVGMLFGDHERKAIARWVSSKANSQTAHDQLKHLAELEPGDFYFWSPSWQKLFGKFRFAPKWTFDGSSSTPLGNDTALGKVAPVDVATLRAVLDPPKLAPAPDAQPVSHYSNGSSPEHAELVAENDELRRRLNESVASLEERLAPLEERVDSADRELEALRADLSSTLDEVQARCKVSAKGLRFEADKLDEIAGYVEAARAVMGAPPEVDRAAPAFVAVAPGVVANQNVVELKRRPRTEAESELARLPRAKPDRKAAKVSAAGGELDEYAERLLSAIKAYGPLTRKQLALVTGVSLVSSTFSTTLGKLHARQWIVTFDGKMQVGDDSEVVFVGDPVAPGTSAFGIARPALARGRAVRDYWRTERLDDYKRKLLDAVLAQRAGLTRKELAAAASVSAVSSTFSTTLGQMKRAGIFEYTGGKVALSPEARWAMLG